MIAAPGQLERNTEAVSKPDHLDFVQENKRQNDLGADL
jgi:hypothetical protein